MTKQMFLLGIAHWRATAGETDSKPKTNGHFPNKNKLYSLGFEQVADWAVYHFLPI